MNIWLIVAVEFFAASVALAILLMLVNADNVSLEIRNRDVAATRATAYGENGKLRAKILAANEAYEALSARRNVAWTRPATRMPSNEVKRAFALDDNAPVWIALNQVIDTYLMDLIDDVSPSPSQSLTAEVRTHLAGGIEHVRLLQKQLLELHATAQKLDADLEGETENKG